MHPKSIPNSVSPWYGLAKFVWSGYTIECPNCGEIYTSRQYWYGNKTPEESVTVRTEITHVWPGALPLDAAQNTAQRVVDGVTYLSEAVASVCSQPTKMITSYVADQIAPKYWRPNNEIKVSKKINYFNQNVVKNFIFILIYFLIALSRMQEMVPTNRSETSLQKLRRRILRRLLFACHACSKIRLAHARSSVQ